MPTKPDTSRTNVTFPNFIQHQLDQMVGAYQPSRPQVVTWIVETWLHENSERVDEQVRKYQAYQADGDDKKPSKTKASK